MRSRRRERLTYRGCTGSVRLDVSHSGPGLVGIEWPGQAPVPLTIRATTARVNTGVNRWRRSFERWFQRITDPLVLKEAGGAPAFQDRVLDSDDRGVDALRNRTVRQDRRSLFTEVRHDRSPVPESPSAGGERCRCGTFRCGSDAFTGTLSINTPNPNGPYCG